MPLNPTNQQILHSHYKNNRFSQDAYLICDFCFSFEADFRLVA